MSDINTPTSQPTSSKHKKPANNHSNNNQLNTDSACFQLKGSMLMLTIMELYHYSHGHFNEQMAVLTKQAPNFFKQTPIIICLEKLAASAEIDFIELTQVCQDYGLFPIAIRGGSEEQQLNALIAGLPKLPAQKQKPPKDESHKNASEQNQTDISEAKETAEAGGDNANQPEKDAIIDTSRPCKIIDRAVRSGQQIYAADADLIIMGPVSQGAEVIADGHIHIYAAARGRIMAGAKGNMSARVFCQSLEPELLSIAGHYKISEDIQGQHWGKAAHARLVDRQLKIEKL